MKLKWIRELRLQNQQVSFSTVHSPEELVFHMLAMQAQVYPMAKWAIGLRVRGCTDKQVENAFNAGKILRTHVLRPTWHFVSPIDIRWLLKLTGPRVRAINERYHVKQELDKKVFKKSNDVLIKTLRDNKHLTRTALQAALKKSRINASGIRLAFIMMEAELEGIICSGGQERNQFTYALLEERVAPVKEINREESLCLLARKYFTSRGPATVNDFSWWSGLTVKDCSNAIEMLKEELTLEIINSRDFYYIHSGVPKTKVDQPAFYMPDFDEYGIAYKDRSAILGEKVSEKSHASLGYPHVLVVDGVIAGTWKITKGARNVRLLETKVPADILKSRKNAISAAGKRFSDFSHLKIST